MTITAESVLSTEARSRFPVNAGSQASGAVCDRTGDTPPETFTVECVRDADDLMDLRNPWNDLAGGIPFRRWEWLVTWWNHFRGRRDELLVLTVTDSTGRIVGIAPWFARVSATRGRVIRFLGSGEVCSDYLTILHAPSHERPVAEALASWLSDHGPRYAWIELAGVSPGDPVVEPFARQLEKRKHIVGERPRESCWRIELPDSWEEYVGQLSKSRRGRVRQLKRRVLDSHGAEVRVSDSHQTLQEGLEVLADLHQKRRTSLGQPGCFASPRFRSFLGDVSQRFLDLGQLRLQWIEVDRRPVVAEIDFLGDDTLFMYQSGMDPEFSLHRPGWLGTIATLHHAIGEGYDHYDFLRGDEPYKAHWRGKARPVVLIRAFPRNFRARLCGALFHVHAKAKRCANTARWLTGSQ